MDDDMEDMDDTDDDTDDIERHGNAMAMPLEHRKAETNAKLATARDLYGVVYRSKGFVWIAGRDDMCGEWGHAGAVLQLGCGGPWMGLLPAEMWPEDGSDERDALERDFGTFIFISVRAVRITACFVHSQPDPHGPPAGAGVHRRSHEPRRDRRRAGSVPGDARGGVEATGGSERTPATGRVEARAARGRVGCRRSFSEVAEPGGHEPRGGRRG